MEGSIRIVEREVHPYGAEQFEGGGNCRLRRCRLIFSTGIWL